MLFCNKYYPKVIDDFYLDNKIKELLKVFIKMDNLNLLLVGNQGSGKSSIINTIINEYYSDNSNSEYNVLHINNLKEQGITYYRNEVKIFCQTKSSILNKKKFIIIDDLDLINEQSQQVFRNCLDKYKYNVNFLCSCTNIQKIMSSLQSRLILVKIPMIDYDNILHLTNKIIKNENIKIDDDSKDFIIKISNNSIKNIINYLQKCYFLNSNINLEIAQKICTNIDYGKFKDFTNYCILASKNNSENLQLNLINAINILNSIYDMGYSVNDILDSYFIYIKISNLIEDNLKFIIIKLLCKYITYFYSLHEDEIELALFTNDIIKEMISYYN